MFLMKAAFLGVDTENPGHCCTIKQEKPFYLLPPEELLEEVVRLRLSPPISLLTSVRRSVDILFLEEIIYILQLKQVFIWS